MYNKEGEYTMKSDKATTAAVTPIQGDRLLTTREAAAIIGLAPGTLARARVYGTLGYPNFVRIGGKAIRYRLSTLQQYIASQTEYKHTTQADQQA
jgi:predicted DNA-binding transcriptional regulator AlpA